MVSEDLDPSDVSRDRGILNETDRKWLLTPKEEFVAEYSPQYWGQRRDEFVSRFTNALLDFRFLADNYNEHVARLFQEADDELVDAMIGALSVLFRGTRPLIRYRSSYTRFEDLLMRAVREAVAAADDSIPDASVVDVRLENGTIEYELREGAIDLEEIGKKIAAGETSDLDRNQLEYFVDYYQRSGELDPETPAEHQRAEWAALQDRHEQRDTDENGE